MLSSSGKFVAHQMSSEATAISLALQGFPKYFHLDGLTLYRQITEAIDATWRCPLAAIYGRAVLLFQVEQLELQHYIFRG